MTRRSLFVGAFLVAAVAQADTNRTPTELYRWAGKPSGIVHLRDLNGSIKVVPSPDGQLRVVATAWQRNGGEAIPVQVQRKEEGGHVTFCVLWPARNTTCDAQGGYHHEGTVKNAGRVRVDLEVQLPKGATLDAETVNGNVEVAATGGELVATTVNGGVEVDGQRLGRSARHQLGSGNRSIRAETVNGQVRAVTR